MLTEDSRTTRAGFELNYLVQPSYLIHHIIWELQANFSKHPDDLQAWLKGSEWRELTTCHGKLPQGWIFQCLECSYFPAVETCLPLVYTSRLWFCPLGHTSYPSAAAAKSLQSCPTLCDPIDGSLPGSPIPGIFQARVLEWGAIAFSVQWRYPAGKLMILEYLQFTLWSILIAKLFNGILIQWETFESHTACHVISEFLLSTFSRHVFLKICWYYTAVKLGNLHLCNLSYLNLN